MARIPRPLAVVVGSSPLAWAVAQTCAARGFDLVLAGAPPAVTRAGRDCRERGAMVAVVEVEPASPSVVDAVSAALGEQPVDSVVAELVPAIAGDAPAGGGVSVGSLLLAHDLARGMRDRGFGRMLLLAAHAEPSEAVGQLLAGDGISVTRLVVAHADGAPSADALDAGALAVAAFEAMMKGERVVSHRRTGSTTAGAPGDGAAREIPAEPGSGPS
ncbi:MAG TPA: hypothetical protein VGM56_25305 [Byssovorax sp.]|jgi:hypothetical protein